MKHIPHSCRAIFLIMFLCMFAFAGPGNSYHNRANVPVVDSSQYYREKIIEKVEFIRNDVLTLKH